MFGQLFRQTTIRTRVGLATAAAFGSLLSYNTFTAGGKQSLSPKEWTSFKIKNIETYNHNTKLYTVDCADQTEVPVASCLSVRAPDGKVTDADGKDIGRPYTPIRQKDGEITLLIKTYPDGKLTPYLNKSQVGDEILMMGPWMKIKYEPNMKKEIIMLAGGTGITPMLQVIKKIVENPSDKTQVNLLFANVTEGDILLKEELDALSVQHENLSVTHVLEKPSSSWRGLSGFINKQILENKIAKPSDDNMVFVCGPGPFVNALAGKKDGRKQGPIGGALKDLGFTVDQVFKF